MIVRPSEKQQIQTQLQECYQLLCDSRQFYSAGIEKRNSARQDYPHPVYLTPLDPAGQAELDESYGVLGRRISDRGFDFYHREPIVDKFVIASFEYSPNRWIGIKMKLNWCRFGRHGYFENGGEFLEVVDSPFGVGLVD